MSKPCLGVAAAAALLSASGTARATWSIVIVDTRTGELAAGSATCLTNINLKDETPVVVMGRGAATAQALLEPTGVTRSDLRQGLLRLDDPQQILASLAFNDTGHRSRQYGLVDVRGRAMTFTGQAANDWAGGVTGRIERGRPGPDDDIVYAVQGNILTGAGVVLAAEAAILASDGDLADMLMESMQAARITGGDGRCSCTSGGPTSCGTPPSDNPDDFKSADVGYMIVGRLGDEDGSRALYRFFDAGDLLGADLNGDGRDELLAFNQFLEITRVYEYLDASVPGALGIERLDDLNIGVGGARTSVVADVNGDGLDDLVLADGPSGNVWIAPGAAGGSIGDAGAVLLLGLTDVVELLATDLDGVGGDDLVALTGSGAVFPVPGGAGSSLTPGGFISGNAETIAAGDLNGDGLPDVLAVDGADGRLRILASDGSGGLSPAGQVLTGSEILDAGAMDVVPGGPTEIIVAEAGSRDVRALDASGNELSAVRSGFDPRLFIEGNFVDGVEGEVAVLSNRRLTVVGPDGAGGLEVLNFEGTAETLIDPVALDLNGDGLDEIAGGIADPNTSQRLLLVENRGGELSEPRGWGDGRYFLTLNVANTQRSDPDPVVTLQDRFDNWRANNAGRVDAVLSRVVGGGVVAPGAQAVFEVDLQAYPGVPISTTPIVTAEFSDPGVASVIGVEDRGNGQFAIRVEGVAEGTTALHVIADDGGPRPTVLMPAPTLRVLSDPADFNADGLRDDQDLLDFTQAFLSGDLSADYNGDGVLDLGDIRALLGWL
ncbi:MAG: DUF1028 domain-containing protein [Phycisphaerales bacterium JB040]